MVFSTVCVCYKRDAIPLYYLLPLINDDFGLKFCLGKSTNSFRFRVKHMFAFPARSEFSKNPTGSSASSPASTRGKRFSRSLATIP